MAPKKRHQGTECKRTKRQKPSSSSSSRVEIVELEDSDFDDDEVDEKKIGVPPPAVAAAVAEQPWVGAPRQLQVMCMEYSTTISDEKSGELDTEFINNFFGHSAINEWFRGYILPRLTAKDIVSSTNSLLVRCFEKGRLDLVHRLLQSVRITETDFTDPVACGDLMKVALTCNRGTTDAYMLQYIWRLVRKQMSTAFNETDKITFDWMDWSENSLSFYLGEMHTYLKPNHARLLQLVQSVYRYSQNSRFIERLLECHVKTCQTPMTQDEKDGVMAHVLIVLTQPEEDFEMNITHILPTLKSVAGIIGFQQFSRYPHYDVVDSNTKSQTDSDIVEACEFLIGQMAFHETDAENILAFLFDRGFVNQPYFRILIDQANNQSARLTVRIARLWQKYIIDKGLV